MPSGRIVCDNCGCKINLAHRHIIVVPHQGTRDPAHWCRQCSVLAAALLAEVQSWLIDGNVSPT
jgi:hypothetical protein